MAQPNQITSRDNARVKQAVRIARDAVVRAETGLFFAEGLRLCQDLAAVQKPVVAFVEQWLAQQQPGLLQLAGETFVVSGPVAEKLAETKNTQGLFCLFPIPQGGMELLQPQKGVLLCEAIQDPANLGAMLRCAAGLGLGGVVLSPGCADPYGPKALRAAMGATLRQAVVCGIPLEQAARQLKAQGCTLYAAALDEKAAPLPGLAPKRPFGLLVGNEGAGLSPQAIALSDERVYIPMDNGMESLNLATAAAVLIYHFKNN